MEVVNVIYQFFIGLLAFSLAYVLLKQSNIFNNEKVNKLIALSFGLFAFGRTDIGNWLSYAIPEMSMLILTILALIIAVGLIFPMKDEKMKEFVKGLVFFASTAIIAYFFIAPMLPKGATGTKINIYVDPGVIVLGVMLLTFVGIMWWLSKPEGEKQESNAEK